MTDRHTRLLNEFSRKESEAKLRKQIEKSREEVEINGGGTSGYTIKEGKNAGTVLKHLKKDSKKQPLKIIIWKTGEYKGRLKNH